MVFPLGAFPLGSRCRVDRYRRTRKEPFRQKHMARRAYYRDPSFASMGLPVESADEEN